MTNSHSIWVKLDRFPPILVRLLATRPPQYDQLMSDDEIVRRASRDDVKLTLSEVKRLSWSPSWDGVPVGTMRAFCIGCDIDFADRDRMRTLTRYIGKSPKWRHLRNHDNYPEFRRMLALLLPS